MPDALSTRQRSLLDFIVTFIDDHGYPPSVRDMQDGCSISSTSVVAYNLVQLEQKGWIARLPDVSRAIEVLGGNGLRSQQTIAVPVLGMLAAGIPIPVAPQDLQPEDIVEITDAQARGRSGLYALRVTGTSLYYSLLADGDLAVLQPWGMPDPGDPVAGWRHARGETFVARYYPEGKTVRLQPSDPTKEPFYEDARDVQVQARLVAMIRCL